MKKSRIMATLVCALSLVLLGMTLPVYADSDAPRASDVEKAPAKTHPAEEGKKDGQPRVIGSLETKQGVIVITSGPAGPRYTVRGKDGAVIAERLSESELQAKHPEFHRRIKGAIADGTVWAGM